MFSVKQLVDLGCFSDEYRFSFLADDSRTRHFSFVLCRRNGEKKKKKSEDEEGE